MPSVWVVLLSRGVGEQSATWLSALPGPAVGGAGLVSACGIGVLLEDVRATRCHHPVQLKQNGDGRRKAHVARSIVAIFDQRAYSLLVLFTDRSNGEAALGRHFTSAHQAKGVTVVSVRGA